MAKYKVITISVAVKYNRIAKFGELVDDSELTANPSEMIKAGSIELVQSDELEEVIEEVSDLKSEIETDKELEKSNKEAKEKKIVSKKDEIKEKLASKK
jgi:hypothetical protein